MSNPLLSGSRPDNWTTKTQHVLTLLTFFWLPLSKSAPLILTLLISILWVFEPIKLKLDNLKKNKLSVFLIVLFLFYPLSLLWSEDLNFGIQRSFDLIWLLFIAITISQCNEERVKAYLLSFVAGASIHAIFFILGYFELLNLLKSTPHDPSISGNRNTYGPIIAIAGIATVYLTLTTSTWSKIKKSLGLALSLFLIVTVLLNLSRTGHAILITLSLTTIAFFVHMKQKKLLGALATGLALIILLPSMLTLDSVQQRFSQVLSDIELYERTALTSTGVRLNFYQNTFALQLDRPFLEKVLGSGIGDYVSDYNDFIGRQPDTLPGLIHEKEDIKGWIRFKDLHSQYLMNILIFGFTGLSFIAVLATLVYRQTKSRKNHIFTGLFFSVFVALMVNSISQSAMETRGLAPTYFLILGLLFSNPQRQKYTDE